MATITIDKDQLKDLVRENLAELLRSRQDLLEVIEDLAFGKLMEAGDKGDLVSEETIFKTLGVK
jgi:hypothetical protein